MISKMVMNMLKVEYFHLMECFECGACSFVCPSHIPLVQYFRIAKSQLKKTQPTKQHAA